MVSMIIFCTLINLWALLYGTLFPKIESNSKMAMISGLVMGILSCGSQLGALMASLALKFLDIHDLDIYLKYLIVNDTWNLSVLFTTIPQQLSD